MSSGQQAAQTVLPPLAASKFANLEFSVHECPRLLLKELERCFPEYMTEKEKGIEVMGVAVLQKSNIDLVSWGDAQAVEKDRLLLEVCARGFIR